MPSAAKRTLPVLLALLAVASCGPAEPPPVAQKLEIKVRPLKGKGVEVTWTRITRDGSEVAYTVYRWIGDKTAGHHVTARGTVSFEDTQGPFVGGVARKYEVAVNAGKEEDGGPKDGVKSEPATYDGLGDLDGDGVTKGDCDDLDGTVASGKAEIWLSCHTCGSETQGFVGRPQV